MPSSATKSAAKSKHTTKKTTMLEKLKKQKALVSKVFNKKSLSSNYIFIKMFHNLVKIKVS
jgi:hypothetical protein